jgi:drug/metabolite transporter (DMT)-like permease
MNSVKTEKRYIPIFLIIIAVIFWGYSFISTKIVLKVIPPVSIAFFRQIIAGITLFAIVIPTGQFKKMRLKHLLLIAASGFFGIILYFIFENTGLKYTSASNASMIVAAVPIFTLLSEAIFFKLKLNFKMILCIVISLIGVYLVISSNGRLDFSSKKLFGNILMLGAMISWVIYTIMNKSLVKKYSSVMITTYQTIVCIFLFIPFIIPEIKEWKAVSLEPLINLVFLGVFCSACAYFCYIYAAKRLGASIASAFLNLIPVVSIISGSIVLGERLSIIQYMGMLLIILSLLLLNQKFISGRQEIK